MNLIDGTRLQWHLFPKFHVGLQDKQQDRETSGKIFNSWSGGAVPTHRLHTGKNDKTFPKFPVRGDDTLI